MYSQSENTNYYIKFPYTDKKNKPLKIWENLNEILEVNNISVMYNEIAKDIEISGVEGTTLESQLMAIHSLSSKYGFSLTLNAINNFVNKIANNNLTILKEFSLYEYISSKVFSSPIFNLKFTLFSLL